MGLGDDGAYNPSVAFGDSSPYTGEPYDVGIPLRSWNERSPEVQEALPPAGAWGSAPHSPPRITAAG